MNFLEKIPSDILAQTSYKTHAYSRALLHIEAYIRDHPQQMKEHLRFLQVCVLCFRDSEKGTPYLYFSMQDYKAELLFMK